MSGFELQLTLPGDARYCETLRAVAAHAAYHAGCREERAARFASDVEDAMRSCLDGEAQPLGIAFRQVDDRLEVVLTLGTRIARTLQIDV